MWTNSGVFRTIARAVLMHRPRFVSPAAGTKDTDWTQELFRFFNIRTGAADILTG